MTSDSQSPNHADGPISDAALFKALGDANRLLMLGEIAANPGICACRLLETFDMSQSTLSHHMSLLKNAGFITCEKRGKWCRYTLSESGFLAASTYVDRMLERARQHRLEG